MRKKKIRMEEGRGRDIELLQRHVLRKVCPVCLTTESGVGWDGGEPSSSNRWTVGGGLNHREASAKFLKILLAHSFQPLLPFRASSE